MATEDGFIGVGAECSSLKYLAAEAEKWQQIQYEFSVLK
jgi:hypothetical protein